MIAFQTVTHILGDGTVVIDGEQSTLERLEHFDMLEAFVNDETKREVHRKMILDAFGPDGEGWRSIAAYIGFSQEEMDRFEKHWQYSDEIICGCVEAIKYVGPFATLHFTAQFTGEYGVSIATNNDGEYTCIICIAKDATEPHPEHLDYRLGKRTMVEPALDMVANGWDGL